MPPGASLVIEAECSFDASVILNRLSRVDGVHAVFTMENMDGSRGIIVMWRSLDEAVEWIRGGGIDGLLGSCGYRYKLYRVTGHEHGPAHPGHHHDHHHEH